MSEATYWEEREAEEVARMEEAIEGMTPDEVYGYCRKLEDDRIRKHFSSTDIGKLENEMFCSLDQLVDSFEDPSKIQTLSDNGNGKASICASERTEAVSIALTRLSPNDRAFAQAVLEGKSWRDLRMSKSTFYRRLKNVENFLAR